MSSVPISFFGYVEDEAQAQILFDFIRQGDCRLLTRRLDTREQSWIASGSLIFFLFFFFYLKFQFSKSIQIISLKNIE